MDVLESQFSLLLGNITSTLDFESIKLSHEHFVATLQGQLFLSMPSVSACGEDGWGERRVCACMYMCVRVCACVHACTMCVWACCPLHCPTPQVFSCLCDILDTCTSFSAILHATDLIFTLRDREQINLLAKVRAKVSVDPQ